MVRILTYNEIDKQQWQALIDRSPYATWFQTQEAYEFYAAVGGELIPFAFGVEEYEGDEAMRQSGDKAGLRDKLQKYLEENGVGTVIHYPIAPHKQECYVNEGWNTPELSLPITEMLADCELSLPISPTMSLSQAEEVVRLINEWKG
jgi:hypothetical protein